MSKRSYGHPGSRALNSRQDRQSGSAKRSHQSHYNAAPILPIFEHSGLLALEAHNKQGIALQHVEPPDSIAPITYFSSKKIPKHKRTRFEVLLYKKKGQAIESDSEPIVQRWQLLDKSNYIIGRHLGRSLRSTNDVENNQADAQEAVVADIGIPEETVSKQHCVIQFRIKEGYLVPYVMDLNSSNGTLLNGSALPSARYIELWPGDVLEFSEHAEETEYELVFVAA